MKIPSFFAPMRRPKIPLLEKVEEKWKKSGIWPPKSGKLEEKWKTNSSFLPLFFHFFQKWNSGGFGGLLKVVFLSSLKKSDRFCFIFVGDGPQPLYAHARD